MASPASAPNPGVSFDLNQELIQQGFLDGKGAVSVSLTAKTDQAILTKIAANAPLGSDEATVAQFGVQAKVSTSGKDAITFLKNGSVSFSGSLNDYASLGFYPDPTGDDFQTAIAPVDDAGLSLKRDPNLTWCLLRWGADEDASASGSIALAGGIGSLSLSAQQHGELFFAVLRQVPRTMGTRDALAAVVKSWRLPSQIMGDTDLEPGAYLLAELGGSVGLKIDATFGHTFNWMRQATLGQLTGDIGLKLQLGLETSLGLTAQGKYAIIAARESLNPADRVIRVRLYRLKSSEFDFALSLQAAATLELPVSDDYHDLFEAALGVHGLQILKKLESWTQPDAIPDILSKLSQDYLSQFLQKVTGLTFEQAKMKLSNFINKWNNLPHSVASLFAKEAMKAMPDFAKIKALAGLIATQDHDSFVKFVTPLLGAGFVKDPAFGWLEAIADQGGLTLLEDIPGFQRLQGVAQKTLDFLNGDSLESLLSKILNELEQRIGLDSILKVTENNFAGLDQLLLSRLQAFFDQTPVFNDIESLQKTIHNLLSDNKLEMFYKKAVDALTNTYAAKLNFAYQSTSSDKALLDVSFDFANPTVGPVLANLLAGKIDDLLSKPVAGVKVNSGTLTHAIKRTAHVDITLPFLTTSADWLESATATFNAVDQDNGRVSFYQLDAKNQEITKNSLFHSRNYRATTLTLSGFLPQTLQNGAGIAIHPNTAAEQQESATAVSSIRYEVKNMSRKDLDSTVRPAALQFLPRVFQSTASFDQWVDTGNLLKNPANAIASLDVNIPPRVPMAWFNNSPLNHNDSRYMDMSIRIQKLLKTLLPWYLFSDLTYFKDISLSSVVLVYQCIRPANSINVDGNTITFTKDDVYWDPPFPQEFQAMTATALAGLKTAIGVVYSRLQGAGMKKLAQFYAPGQEQARFEDAQQESSKVLLQGLLNMERVVTTTARDAGVEIAKFNQAIGSSPSDAVKHLASAGRQLTAAFNNDLATAIAGDALPRLAPAIFADAAIALDPSIGALSADAVLNVTVLKPGVSLPDDFPEFTLDADSIQVSLNAESLAA